MKKHHGAEISQADGSARDNIASAVQELPTHLMTVCEVAQFVGCHEESVRRAYLCGQLKAQRFGVAKVNGSQ